jgi:pimeloyl-ACP methyl ester carboxylesterase
VHAFAISRRGHGNSDKPKLGYAPKNFAADIAAFIQQKKLGKVVVVGHSMGGVNAQQLAISYPSLVRALVIVDSDPAIGNNQGVPEFTSAVQQLKGDAIPYQFMLEFQQSTLAKPIDSAWFKLLVDEGLKCPLPIFKSALQNIVKADLTHGLKKLSIPVLIFWGDKDTVCFEKGQQQMKQALKNETQIVYEGTGHALHWEQPERFANDLTKFLDGLSK